MLIRLDRSWIRRRWGMPAAVGSFALVAALLATLLTACGGSSDGGGPTAPPAPSGDPIQDVIQALFFASGPLASADGGCGGRRVYAAYPAGSNVRVVLGSGVSAANVAAVRSEMSALEAAMAGYLSIGVTGSAEPEPVPSSLEIVLVEVDRDRFLQLCPANVSGTGGCVVSALAVVRDQALVAAAAGSGPLVGIHEIGHAFGFCHLGPDGYVMSASGVGPPAWTGDELEAVRRVYSSGLQPGATQADARALGLIP